MTKRFFSSLIVVFFIGWVGVVSCGKISRSIDQPKLAQVDTMLTKTISFPRSLQLLEARQANLFDSIMHASKRKRIVSIVDATCRPCITDQLNVLDSLFAAMIGGLDCDVVLIVNQKKEDSLNFVLNLKPLVKVKGLVLVDRNFDFERSNRILTEYSYYRTFLVNEVGKIEFYGNPLMDTTLISVYRNRLRD